MWLQDYLQGDIPQVTGSMSGYYTITFAHTQNQGSAFGDLQHIYFILKKIFWGTFLLKNV